MDFWVAFLDKIVVHVMGVSVYFVRLPAAPVLLIWIYHVLSMYQWGHWLLWSVRAEHRLFSIWAIITGLSDSDVVLSKYLGMDGKCWVCHLYEHKSLLYYYSNASYYQKNIIWIATQGTWNSIHYFAGSWCIVFLFLNFQLLLFALFFHCKIEHFWNRYSWSRMAEFCFLLGVAGDFWWEHHPQPQIK